MANLAPGALFANSIPESAAPRFVLIDRELRVEIVELVSIEGDAVECRREGLIDRRDLADVLALARWDGGAAGHRDGNGPEAAALATPTRRDSARDAASRERGSVPSVPPAQAAHLALVDGQRFTGTWMPASSPDDLGWRHPLLGEIVVPLDDVRAARFEAGASIPRADENAEGDRLLLVNGDALIGFVASANREIVFEPLDTGGGDGGNGGAAVFTADQVASLSLVNAPRRPEGVHLWLADGSVIAVQTNSDDADSESDADGVGACSWRAGGSLQFTPEAIGRPAALDAGAFLGACFDAGAFVPLAAIEPARVEAISPLLQTVEPPALLGESRPLDLADVRLRGPVEVAYALPPGAVRFAAIATVPRENADWADLELVIEIDGRETLRERMDGTGRSRREIALDLADGGGPPSAPAGASARTLVIRVEEAARGPIQDVVVLERPALLVK